MRDEEELKRLSLGDYEKRVKKGDNTILLSEEEDYEVWRVNIEKPMKMSLRESVAWQKGWEIGFKAGKESGK